MIKFETCRESITRTVLHTLYHAVATAKYERVFSDLRMDLSKWQTWATLKKSIRKLENEISGWPSWNILYRDFYWLQGRERRASATNDWYDLWHKNWLSKLQAKRLSAKKVVRDVRSITGAPTHGCLYSRTVYMYTSLREKLLW